MKEEDFIKKFPSGKIEVEIYYYVDDDGEVVIDEDSMNEECEFRFQEVLEFMNKDELQLMVSEKLQKIKNDNI